MAPESIRPSLAILHGDLPGGWVRCHGLAQLRVRQGHIDVVVVDTLTSITGSRVRADVLAALFGPRTRSWLPSELGRVVRRPRQLVNRELKRLAGAGVVRAKLADGKRQYEPDAEEPVVRELSRLIRQTRGRVPRLRHALVALRSPTLAWIIAAGTNGHVPTVRRPHDLIVLTGAPRSLVRVQLLNVVDGGIEIHPMSMREWVTRLDKGDVFLRRARRQRKLWVLGSWQELLRRERSALEARRTLSSAMADWREEPSDEWDEEWDPFAPVPGSS